MLKYISALFLLFLSAKSFTQNTQTTTKIPVVPSPDSSIDPNKTMIYREVNGKVVGTMEDIPNYPAGASKGPQHTIRGTVLALTLEQPGKKIPLYTNNYFKVVFTTANYEPNGDIKPCEGIQDMKATIRYAEVSNKNVAGQILAIELSK